MWVRFTRRGGFGYNGDLTGSNKRRLIRGVNVLYAAGKVRILPAALLQIPADMLK